MYSSLKVAHFLAAIQRSSLLPTLTTQRIQNNGQPGHINYVNGKPHSVFTFDIQADEIRSIFAVVNPMKLQRIQRK